MTWHEPRVIARRLAAGLGVSVRERPEDPIACVLLLDEDRFAALDDAALEAAAAVVAFGAPSGATSRGLTALRASVTARGGETLLATFATVPDADGTAADVPLVVAAKPGEDRVRDLLAAGPHALTLDAAVDASPTSATAPGARVCIVSFEASGMTGGGIGTASSSLAELLARSGHEMTLLFTGWQDAGADERNERWREHYAGRGVRLELLRAPGTNTVKSPHFPARSAYEVYCWLRRQEPFDVVHLPENMGHGAYAQAAKRQGSHFAATTFVIGTHGPTRWAAEANRVALTHEELLVNDAFERASVARADVLLGPSRYLHDYLRDRGWALPERVHVQPYATPSAVREAGGTPADSELPREIVFFGRLETRKGVGTLCAALDLLAASGEHPELEITFLGPVAQVLGEPAGAYIAARAAAWPWPWRIVSDRDQRAAAAYLARPGVLAVMPSLVDNAPNTVSEAVALGIPLVAGRAGGTGELVDAERRDDHTFGDARGTLLPPSLQAAVPAVEARPLAELLRRRLTTHVVPATPPVEPAAVDAAYDRWHRAVRRDRQQRTTPGAAAGTELPSLAVCVLFDGDAELLVAQLTALDEERAAGDVEVVVANLRDPPGEAPAPAAQRAVPVVRPQRPGHASEARAAAIDATRAALVAFLPPGDVPLPGFAGGLRRAVAATGAHVCSCAVLDERDGACADAAAAMVRAFVPLAGPPLAGLGHPAFAAGPYAIRRDVLAQLGGFAADARGDEADHELLNRAAAAGHTFEVVPEPLAAKRRRDRWTTFRAVWPHATVEPPYDAEQWLRVERPLAANGAAAEDLIGLLRGARAEAVRFQAELHQQHGVYEGRFAEQRTWIGDLEAEAVALRAEQAELAAKLARQPARLLARAARATARRLLRRPQR
jgi:O-antigen biosynthesis protein